MKKILLGLLVTGAVGGVALLATNAFFSDTETSTGNLFQAGEINLKIDNESYVDQGLGLVFNDGTSWGENGGVEGAEVGKFFNFVDLKPGDNGEDTISIHLSSNPAWMCVDLDITANSDETCTEPENDLDAENNTCVVETNGANGDLAEGINFAFWKDDGDNVYEVGETILAEGPAGNVLGGVTWALADSSIEGDPIQPGVSYIGKAWCYGALEMTPVAVAEYDNPTTQVKGYTCNGSLVGNEGQTDLLTGNITFRAVQSRHNPDFVCQRSEEERPLVGALLSSYQVPGQTCNVTVNPGNSIQAAIDAATAGETICLADGIHNSDTYPLRVNEDNLKLVGVNAPLASATLSGGVVLDNDGTKVSGLVIGSSTLLGETFGVYINTGVDNAEVSYNKIIGTSTAVGRGIVNATGTTTNAVYKHNVINTWLTGIFLNPSSGMLADYNTITGNGVGIGNDNPSNNTLSHNVIKSNSIEGVGALLNGAESLNVNLNNLYSNGAGDDLNSYGAISVNAENNWWGDLTPADNVSGPVDFDPFEASAFAE